MFADARPNCIDRPDYLVAGNQRQRARQVEIALHCMQVSAADAAGVDAYPYLTGRRFGHGRGGGEGEAIASNLAGLVQLHGAHTMMIPCLLPFLPTFTTTTPR